ncbi:MAG: hypothetical protein E3J35_01925 [Methanomassiliicoccales archaeon]|nr:MAG: hypothetical protein E3J35_01925 [Methanomassiliicoccales archaeon]
MTKAGRPPKIGEKAILEVLSDKKPRFSWEIANVLKCDRRYVEYYLWRRRYGSNEPSLLEKGLVKMEILAEIPTGDSKRALRHFYITKKGIAFLKR